MTKFISAVIPEEEIQRNIEDYVAQWRNGDTHVREAFPAADESAARAAITSMFRDIKAQEEVWLNDTYQVNVRKLEGGIVHLSIRRIDRKVIHDWRDLQRIKNELVGPECEGLELYPAESRLVDTANQYHLWVNSNPKYRLPVGWDQGRLVSDKSIGKSVNRPLEPTSPCGKCGHPNCGYCS